MRISGIAIGSFLLVNWATAMATDMECGTYTISEDETDGQTMSEIRQTCGEPGEVDGNAWYYKKEEGVTYQLRFDDNGELESITTQ